MPQYNLARPIDNADSLVDRLRTLRPDPRHRASLLLEFGTKRFKRFDKPLDFETKVGAGDVAKECGHLAVSIFVGDALGAHLDERVTKRRDES